MKDETGHSHFKVDYHNSAFLSDLSARDFAVLAAAGWYPLDLVAGVSFIHAPRRSVGTAVGQSTQNVELTNFTDTLLPGAGGGDGRAPAPYHPGRRTGLVDAKIVDRPVPFATT